MLTSQCHCYTGIIIILILHLSVSDVCDVCDVRAGGHIAKNIFFLFKAEV